MTKCYGNFQLSGHFFAKPECVSVALPSITPFLPLVQYMTLGGKLRHQENWDSECTKALCAQRFLLHMRSAWGFLAEKLDLLKNGWKRRSAEEHFTVTVGRP